MREVIAEGVTLIKKFERLELTAYKCPADKWTIGYGHTTAYDKNGNPLPDPALELVTGDAGPVRAGMTITEAQAEEILRIDLAGKAKAVSLLLEHPANDYQFAALVSLAFNLVWKTFKTSSVLRLHNAGDPAAAATAFALLNKARNANKVLVPLKGLTRRRAAEAALYLTPTATEEAADPQRTRAVDVAPAEQSATTSPAIIGGGAIATATAVKELAQELDPVRELIATAGLSAGVVRWVLVAVVLGIVGAGVVTWLRQRQAGRA